MSNNDVLWQTVLGEIEVVLSGATFSTWFKNTSLLSADSGNALIGVPNIFTKKQFEEKYRGLIEKTLRKNGVDLKSLNFKVALNSNVKRVAPPGPNLVNPVPGSRPAVEPPRSTLNKRYTFSNFIVGGSNELAYAAAQAIAREPGERYNPFFVYGGVGLGKTHLIQAIGNEIKSRQPDFVIEYVTSERFKNEFVASILRNTKNFSHKYRNVDVLIIDDMQFIAGKEKTQEEFFHTFNTLHQNNKQIIISSDKPPKAIPTLEERLRSRFEWGMSADIQAPDFETRMAIIQAKTAHYAVAMPVEVIEYIAANIQSNIRELEGAITKLLAHCEMRGAQPTVEMAENLLTSTGVKSKHLTPKHIIDKTARYFNLSITEITGPKRDKEIVEPRQIAMYLMRTELHLSFPQVAKQLGRSDHSTAMHSVDKIEKALTENQQMRQKVLELKEKLYV